MARKTILIIEDEDRLRSYMASALEKAGYLVLEASTIKDAFDHLKNHFLDLVLLDLRLGSADGLNILKTIRRQDEHLPVIIVSSLGDCDTKVDGFSLGCDDYITKPFYIEELIGRVKRLFKRNCMRMAATVPITNQIENGPFLINIQTLSVEKNGIPIIMRRKLFDLFLFFIRHPDTVLSNEVLFNQAWQDYADLNENSLYVHIRQLRLLVEDDPSHPRFIRTVRNFGYKFTTKDDE